MGDNAIPDPNDCERSSSTPFPRVLLVDDEPMMWRLMHHIVGQKFVLETASDALQAVELLNTHKFFIVVTNYNLPGHDGIWLLKMVRQSSPKTQRILLSDQENDAIRESVASGLVHRFIAKPFAQDDFANMFCGEIEKE